MSMLRFNLGRFVRKHWARRRAQGAARRLHASAIRLAIERAVDLANPRIRGLNGYRKTLHGAVAHCLEYCNELAWRIPGPVTVNRRNWSRDPLLRALFDDPSRIRWDLASHDCRDYMRRTPGMTGDCYAILLAQPVWRKQYGLDLAGETLQRDIAQTTLSFENIEVVQCADHPDAVRTKTAAAIMDALVGFAAQAIGRQESRIAELEEQLRIARIRQQVIGPATQGLGLLRNPATHTTEYLIIGREIRELERDLVAAHRGLTTLDDYLERLATLLQQPQALVAARTERVRLDPMNVVRPERGDDQQAAQIEFLRAYHGERAGRMALLVRFSRHDLITDGERLAAVERYVNA